MNSLADSPTLRDQTPRAKLKSAGYSQIREVPSGKPDPSTFLGSGKIKTLKAVKDGQERSIIVDSSGHFKEFQ